MEINKYFQPVGVSRLHHQSPQGNPLYDINQKRKLSKLSLSSTINTNFDKTYGCQDELLKKKGITKRRNKKKKISPRCNERIAIIIHMISLLKTKK